MTAAFTGLMMIPGYQGAVAFADDTGFPESFDLRNVDTDGDGVGDRCYVTSVKNQDPGETTEATETTTQKQAGSGETKTSEIAKPAAAKSNGSSSVGRVSASDTGDINNSVWIVTCIAAAGTLVTAVTAGVIAKRKKSR